MIPLYSTAQVREADSHAISNLGYPGIILMENAARSILSVLEQSLLLSENVQSVGIVCGKGNNGGDGFALARHLANYGFDVRVLYTGNPDDFSKDAQQNFSLLENLDFANNSIELIRYERPANLNKLKDCDLIIDALLGSGAKGELKEPINRIISTINEINCYKAAIDIPTGLDADTGLASLCFKADLTITLGELKIGLFINDGPEYCGIVEKGYIGLNDSAYRAFEVNDYLIEPEDIIEFLPQKKKSIHKYSAGKVFTIAGSSDLPGAAVLASKSVLRTGAGASVLYFPSSVRKLIQKNLDEVVVQEFDDDNKGILNLSDLSAIKKRIAWADVVAIGPGLGRGEPVQEAVKKIIKLCSKKKCVIDADAVYALGNNNYRNINLKNHVLTPHMAEFSHLISVPVDEVRMDIFKYGKLFTEETGAYLVLKGAPTIIFNPAGESFINTTGNPGMAKFGTGDVLTGTIAAMMAMNKNTEAAVISAVYLHSLAADLLLPRYTEFGYTANDIMKNLPAAIKFMRKSFAEVL